MSIENITIIGHSTLSAELAQILTKSGFEVLTTDLTEDYSAKASVAELVLEFLPEDLELKGKVLCDCDARCKGETILVTTTGNPWITRLASNTTRPDRFIGINFVRNWAQGKLFAQVAKGLQTSAQTVEACIESLRRAGLTPVKLEESPGLIIDRMIASVINEAALMYSTRLATIEDIDKMMKLCANWPLGPFELADIVGIDSVVSTLETLHQQLGAKYLPCPLLRKMVDAGWLGKKTGRGFYTYT